VKIEILGTGCPSCLVVEEIVKKAVKELGIKANVEHVYEIEKIIEYGVMLTPAVVINGKIKIEGKIPTIEEAKKMIKEEL
jgi:small redox-active disulfide protein 2